MKINKTLSGCPVQNREMFDDVFFKRFSQKKQSVRLSKTVHKTYSFPTFYKDIRFAAIAFLCSYKKALELMPHPKIRPVKIGRTTALIVFSCYQYKTVKEIEPYNEVGFLIPVLANSVFRLPTLPLLFGKHLKNFGYHVIRMPVTSLESKIRGDEIWGLPKQVNEIDYSMEDAHYVCRIKEEDGGDIFEIKIPTTGGSIHLNETVCLFTRKSNKILKSQAWFEGDFVVNNFAGQLFKRTIPIRKYIEIGDSNTGRLLKSMEIREHPFQTRFSDDLTSAFDLPLEDYRL